MSACVAPLAASSSKNSTLKRVPRTQGLPPRISASETMKSSAIQSSVLRLARRSRGREPHLLLAYPRRRRGIVAVVSPRRMIEVDDAVAVERDRRVGEDHLPDPPPVREGPPLAQLRAVRLPL